MKAFVSKFNLKVNTNFLIVLSALYILLVNNQSFWAGLFNVVDITSIEYMLFSVAVLIALFAVMFALISLFSFRYILKPSIFIIILASSFVSYFIDSFGTIIDVDMIQNIVETDTGEATELVNTSLLLHVFMFGLLPAFLITRLKVKPCSPLSELRARGVALTLIVLLASITSYLAYKNIVFIFRENRQLTFIINPIYPILSLKRYYDQQAKKEVPFNYVFNDATKEIVTSFKAKKSVFVLVVGETARASNFHINGYARNTTPLIEKENIISLDNVFSCGTATAISVPCLFSHLEHDNYDDSLAKNSENLLDAFKRSGLDVLWRDNNSGCKGVCQRVASENMHHLHLDDYCGEDGCFDEVLLHDLQEHIDGLKSDGIIVLHQQGSHGPAYYKRYPDNFAVFEPACNKANVQDCSYNEIVNAYDNTILYTDYFLSKVIQLLKNNAEVYDTAMLYVSDHGESLGENGVYLHGLPYFLAPDEQVHVPLYIWLSDEFSKNTQVDIPCLKQKQHDRYSHDNIVHSLLGVMGVKTGAYKVESDIFSSCKTLS